MIESSAATTAAPAASAAATTSSGAGDGGATNPGTPPAAPAASEASTGGLFDAGDKAVAEATSASRPDFLSDKYATVEDQAKAYSELNKKFMEKAGVPESYDFKGVLANHKEMSMNTESDGFKALVSDLKSEGFNQRQAEWLLDRYIQEASAIRGEADKRINELAPPDLANERNKLQAMWGVKTADNLKQVASWANANLDPVVVNSLNRTSKGVEFIHSMMTGEKGPIPLQDTSVSSGNDVVELEAQRLEVMMRPEYKRTDALGKRLQAKAMALSERIIKVQGGQLVRPG